MRSKSIIILFAVAVAVIHSETKVSSDLKDLRPRGIGGFGIW